MAYTRIILFSSGMDSYILKKVYDFSDEECLFVNLGTKENKIEEKLIDEAFPDTNKVALPLINYELPNKIIPFRNHYLALLAANYGNHIYFAFTAGDTTKDKDYVFKSQIENILNYFSQDTEKIWKQGPFVVHMPFKDMTKTEIVKAYLEKGFDPYLLLRNSSSCYEGHERACGKCRSCLRKFVALTLNDISSYNYWEYQPEGFLNEFLQESIKKNRHHEITDIQLCIQKLQ